MHWCPCVKSLSLVYKKHFQEEAPTYRILSLAPTAGYSLVFHWRLHSAVGGGCGLPPLQGLFIIVAEWAVNILNSIQESCWCHGNLIAAPERPKLLLPPASLYELAEQAQTLVPNDLYVL